MSHTEIHEIIYRQEIAAGATAWGGISEEDRLKGWEPSLNALLSHEDFPIFGNLLELGSGLGTVSRFFARRGYSTSGIEISRSAVEKSQLIARERSLDFRAVHGTAADLSYFRDDEFDAVIDGTCLHCICGGDRSRALGEAFRVLKPKGFFFVSTNCGEPKEEKDLKNFDWQRRCLLKNGEPYRYFGSTDSILKEIQFAGFVIVHFEEKTNPWWNHLVVYAKRP